MSNANFEAFLGRIGLSVTGHAGDGVLVLCPVHGDVSTPSLSIRDDGLHFCFSPACDVSGGSFVWLAQRVGDLTRAAAEDMVAAYGLPKRADGRRVVTPPEHEHVSLGRYHVEWRELVDHMTRGDAWDEPAAVVAGLFLFGTRRLTVTAVEDARVGLDRESGAIVFPQFAVDEAGEAYCVGVTTRRPDEKRFRNAFATRHHVFNLRPDERLQEVVLVEGQLDALAVAGCAPSVRAVAAYGAAVFSGQVELLQRCAERVVLFLDNDLAGVVGTTKWLAQLGPHRCRVVVRYQGNKDAGDMTRVELNAALRDTVCGTTYVTDGAGRHRLQLVRSGAGSLGSAEGPTT